MIYSPEAHAQLLVRYHGSPQAAMTASENYLTRSRVNRGEPPKMNDEELAHKAKVFRALQKMASERLTERPAAA